jgi:hypothetical protein
MELETIKIKCITMHMLEVATVLKLNASTQYSLKRSVLKNISHQQY